MLPKVRASGVGPSSVRFAPLASRARLAPTATTTNRSISTKPAPSILTRPQLIARSPTIHVRASSCSSHTSGSYHSPSSANATLLSDVPSISPRSLVKYLDTYVVGQTKAKKVLAVGVWNHYLRVASNQRMKEEAELRLEQQQQEELARQAEEEQPHTNAEAQEEGLSEASSRSLRLGKFKQPEGLTEKEGKETATVGEGWQSHQRILDERKAERARDPHGEATRSLMFGRSEREWLVNAGGPSAIIEDSSAAGLPDVVPKFGDDPAHALDRPSSSATRRVPAKTPAEEASSQLEQRKMSSASGESALAEAASRMHDAVLSDYTPEPKPRAAEIGVFGADQPLYFSSNAFRSGTRARSKVDDEVEKKWESPQERAAYAAGLAEERTKRALKLARERLSATSSTGSAASGSESASPAETIGAAAASILGGHASPLASLARERPSETPASFLSSSPGTLPFFEKSNILLLGPSGSGKTLLLRTLAQALDVPFVHVDATPLTMAGYVGEDVESIIQRLLVEAGWDVARAQRGIVCIDEIDKLRKAGTGGGAGGGGGGGKDVGGEGVQQALLRMLEGTTIQVADKSGAAAAAQGGAKAAKTGLVRDGAGADEGGRSGGLGPWYNHRMRGRAALESRNGVKVSVGGQPASFNVDTSSILFVLSGAFVGIEEVIRKRLDRLQSSPSPTTTTPSAAAATAAAAGGTPAPTTLPTTKPALDGRTQAELLARLEPTDLEQYGLIPEFIGRVPVSVVLNPLTFSDLVRVMTEPRNSLVDQYTSLFQLNGIELHISHGAIEEIVHRAMGTSSNPQASVTPGSGGGGGGARSLRRIMEEILLDAFYESYGDSSVKYILVDRETVRTAGQVKLFSRGQRFDFEAQCRAEAEHANAGVEGGGEAKAKDKDGKPGKQAQQGQQAQQADELDARRLKSARAKARSVIRARLRRTNRLVDPVIYV